MQYKRTIYGSFIELTKQGMSKNTLEEIVELYIFWEEKGDDIRMNMRKRKINTDKHIMSTIDTMCLKETGLTFFEGSLCYLKKGELEASVPNGTDEIIIKLRKEKL